MRGRKKLFTFYSDVLEQLSN